jgi:uncharacterized protein YjiS (DUF1127 family)
MSDLNGVSTSNAHHPASVVSKSRTDFGVEASSRTTHFCPAVNATSKRYIMLLQTLGPPRAPTRLPRRNTALRGVIGLLRRWQERARTRPQLCELSDHILRDVGLTRDAVLREATRPFWR